MTWLAIGGPTDEEFAFYVFVVTPLVLGVAASLVAWGVYAGKAEAAAGAEEARARLQRRHGLSALDVVVSACYSLVPSTALLGLALFLVQGRPSLLAIFVPNALRIGSGELQGRVAVLSSTTGCMLMLSLAIASRQPLRRALTAVERWCLTLSGASGGLGWCVAAAAVLFGR